MSKMTDERIIKALKHCYEHKSCNDCVGCLGAEECILNVDPAGDIYPIINRQQAEIERLKKHSETVAKEVQDKMTCMCGCKNCIETVTRIIKDDTEPFDRQCNNCNRCKEIKAEAIKEYIDKLLINLEYDYYSCSQELITLIKDTEKEMVGEGK
jgi:hypothetical protein